jgi:hypothetical protein
LTAVHASSVTSRETKVASERVQLPQMPHVRLDSSESGHKYLHVVFSAGPKSD